MFSKKGTAHEYYGFGDMDVGSVIEITKTKLKDRGHRNFVQVRAAISSYSANSVGGDDEKSFSTKLVGESLFVKRIK